MSPQKKKCSLNSSFKGQGLKPNAYFSVQQDEDNLTLASYIQTTSLTNIQARKGHNKRTFK